jgi:hypothetical protein
MDRFDRRDPFQRSNPVETNWHSKGIHLRVSMGSSGSDRYILTPTNHVIHRRAHRTLERMGEGISTSHPAVCHPTHWIFGRFSAKN